MRSGRVQPVTLTPPLIAAREPGADLITVGPEGVPLSSGRTKRGRERRCTPSDSRISIPSSTPGRCRRRISRARFKASATLRSGVVAEPAAESEPEVDDTYILMGAAVIVSDIAAATRANAFLAFMIQIFKPPLGSAKIAILRENIVNFRQKFPSKNVNLALSRLRCTKACRASWV